ncbi:MAG: hypothetical protein SGJ11_06600 [Phycisphaerae bacterium]|nr:hypothetical protein [Phycisphaerae bacterium]
MLETRRPTCPHCGYSLAVIAGPRCPECGWRIDLTTLFHAGRAALPKLTPFVIVAGVVLGPVIFTAALYSFTAAGDLPLKLLFPFTWLVLEFLPSDAAFLGVGAGLLQGPFYGFLLGLCLPPKRYARVDAGVRRARPRNGCCTFPLKTPKLT